MFSRISCLSLAMVFVVGCKAARSGGSQAKDVEDIVSSTRVSDSLHTFEVTCEDKLDAFGQALPGNKEIVTAADIQNNRVCTGRVNIHRSHKSVPGGKLSFLFSLSPSEGTTEGFTYNGPAFRVFTKPDHPNMTLLFRCMRSDGVFFLSQSNQCEGVTNVVGPLGWVYTDQVPHTVPLYRCNLGGAIQTATSSMVTRSTDECISAGYTVDGTIGFGT